MLTNFQELNLYAYHAVRGVVLDLVIWCLGPVVDDSREYGLFRFYLAVATCKACRTWYRIPD